MDTFSWVILSIFVLVQKCNKNMLANYKGIVAHDCLRTTNDVYEAPYMYVLWLWLNPNPKPPGVQTFTLSNTRVRTTNTPALYLYMGKKHKFGTKTSLVRCMHSIDLLGNLKHIMTRFVNHNIACHYVYHHIISWKSIIVNSGINIGPIIVINSAGVFLINSRVAEERSFRTWLTKS